MLLVLNTDFKSSVKGIYRNIYPMGINTYFRLRKLEKELLCKDKALAEADVKGKVQHPLVKQRGWLTHLPEH